MQRSILVVDDDPSIQRLIQRVFQPRGWNVLATDGGVEALSLYESDHPAVVILDLHLPTIHGIDLLDVMRERDSEPAILVLTGDVDPNTAAEVMRRGAENFLTKPVSIQHLEVVVEHAYEKVELRRRSRLAQTLRPQTAFSLVGSSPAMQLLTEQVRRLANTEGTILLQGETGTGKNRVAAMIHECSPRAGGAFVELNCAGISANELESELFGYEKSAFTGATEQYRGLLELADGGTLLLDGIGGLPLEAQDKLLRFVQTGKLRRLGEGRELHVDVRIIATTSHNLAENVRCGLFREDLFFRLAAFPLRLPALRDRTRADILALAMDVLQELQRSTSTGSAIRIAEAAADLLASYPWPGNIRELRNVLERALIYEADVDTIQPQHLPPEIRGEIRAQHLRYPLDPALPLEEVERLHIQAALRFHGGNRSAAARSLGIARRTLYDKLERWGMSDGSTASSGSGTGPPSTDLPFDLNDRGLARPGEAPRRPDRTTQHV